MEKVYRSNSVLEEKEIFERICKGDEKSLEVLYKKYFRMMTKMVITNSGTEEEARDVYQDALIVFWQKATSGKLVMTAKISTYIYSICQNLWRKELDRKKRLSNEEKDIPVSQDTESEERNRIVGQCIEQLGETCKKVLMYYYFEEMSMQDIADKLGFARSRFPAWLALALGHPVGHPVVAMHALRAAWIRGGGLAR